MNRNNTLGEVLEVGKMRQYGVRKRRVHAVTGVSRPLIVWTAQSSVHSILPNTFSAIDSYRYGRLARMVLATKRLSHCLLTELTRSRLPRRHASTRARWLRAVVCMYSLYEEMVEVHVKNPRSIFGPSLLTQHWPTFRSTVLLKAGQCWQDWS